LLAIETKNLNNKTHKSLEINKIIAAATPSREFKSQKLLLYIIYNIRSLANKNRYQFVE